MNRDPEIEYLLRLAETAEPGPERTEQGAANMRELAAEIRKLQAEKGVGRATVNKAAGTFVLLAVLLLQACIPPCKDCPPPIVTSTPTPVSTPEVKPTPRPTSAPTATRTPGSIPTGSLAPLTSGKAILEVDLSGFSVEPNLDYYAIATLLWDAPPPGRDKPATPALELSVRGTSDELCAVAPCGASAELGLVVRWSSDIAHDAVTPDERLHCGNGLVYSKRLPVGISRRFLVTVEWKPGSVTVSTPAGSWTTTKGAAGPGFGWWGLGVGRPPLGVGWAREPWTVQVHGGSVRLLSWTSVGQQGEIATCP